MAQAAAKVAETKPGRGPRYNEIILSSIEVFSRTNYEKATTAMLAKEAGVAEGTLYKLLPQQERALPGVLSVRRGASA